MRRCAPAVLALSLAAAPLACKKESTPAKATAAEPAAEPPADAATATVVAASAASADAATDAATATAGDDDCMVDSTTLEGALDHKAAGVTSLAPPKVKEQHLQESIRRGDGVTVVYDVGGCVHFSYSYKFSPIPVQKSASEYLRVAGELLRTTPRVGEDEQILPRALEEAGKQNPAPGDDGYIALPCGDANCSLQIEKGGAPSEVSLTVLYDFPL